jgi:oxygen-dependent protoporphyrinogen oxidase
MRARKVTVIGGGIAGLAAALRLLDAGAEVDLFEGSGRLGGKLRTGGDGLEEGAETFLMRDPAGGPSAAVLLARQLGLEDQIVHPTGVPAGLYVNGALRPLPGGTFLGIPGPQSDLADVARIKGSDVDNGRPVLTHDISVGELVRERFGREIVAKLVDPLLGGVYAGRADGLSVAATMPGLYKLLQEEHTLGRAVERAIAASKAHAASPSPMFGTIKGGLSRLIEAATDRLGDRIHLGRWVTQLPEGPVVIAVPAPKALRLLPFGDFGMGYASVALVTIELPETEAKLPELSGFLVPETEGLSIKAATFFSKKWAHVGGCVVRVSLGRAGDSATLQATDEALIETAIGDLSKVVGGLPATPQCRPVPVKAKIDRWGGGLPQYPPGHVDRVAAARERLRDMPVALAGAAFDGVGIPACAKSGRNAAELLLERWMS